jgi:hypothetical protein
MRIHARICALGARVCAAGLDADGADRHEKGFAREADTLAQDTRPHSEEGLP